MSLSIRAKADTIGTFRFISVHLMEMLARWVPTTAELEVKVLFGRHLWEFAQHADQLGKRTSDLRVAPHYSPRPTEEYMRALEMLSSTPGTAERVEGFYQGFLPTLEARYRDYLAGSDRLLDEPSVRIIERILIDLERLRSEREELGRQRPDLKLKDPSWPSRVATLAAGPAEFVVFRPATAAEPA